MVFYAFFKFFLGETFFDTITSVVLFVFFIFYFTDIFVLFVIDAAES